MAGSFEQQAGPSISRSPVLAPSMSLQLGLRFSQFVLCLIAFAVMASSRHEVRCVWFLAATPSILTTCDEILIVRIRIAQIHEDGGESDRVNLGSNCHGSLVSNGPFKKHILSGWLCGHGQFLSGKLFLDFAH